MKLLWKTHIPVMLLVASASVSAIASTPSAPASGKTPAPSGRALFDSVPAAWSYESPQLTTLPSDDRWWEGFDDPVLTSLIDRGEANSLDLRQTYRRIEMARQSVLADKAGYSPTLDLSAGWTKQRSSGDMNGIGRAVNMHYFNLGLNFAWEIDVFGRVREQVKAGKANYNYSRMEYQAAMITLAANIATSYVNLRLAQGRIAVAREQIKSQEKIKTITEARYEAGLASKLDVTQALTVLYSTQSTLPGLENAARSAVRSLALLTGCYPDSISALLEAPKPLPNPFRMVSIGVPADLLRRRPDIAAAEYQLAAYAAQAGIAKKDFLPVLSLNGSVGTSARDIGDMFSKNSLTYSIAPALTWTVFEGLARNRRVAEAKEQYLAGLDAYNLAVMTAVIETEDALGSYEAGLKEIALVQKVVQQSEESFQLAIDRYKRGLTAFTDVMNSLENMLEYHNTLLQTKAGALQSLISVYAAVAGNPEQ